MFRALYINYDEVILPKLFNLGGIVKVLSEMSEKCNQMAIDNIVNMTDDNIDDNIDDKINFLKYNPFPKYPLKDNGIRALILVLPEIVMKNLDQLSPKEKLEVLNKGEIFNQSLGHCFTAFDKNKHVCNIYDVCMHTSYLGKQSKMGSKLFGSILDSLQINLPNKTTLWLGVDILNNYFDKVIYLYAKHGFKTPYIYNRDLIGNNYSDTKFLALTRINDYIDPESIKLHDVTNSVLYAITQYLKLQNNFYNTSAISNAKTGIDYDLSNGINNCCNIVLQFDKNYARWLKSLPNSASTLNSSGTITQKEVGGLFSINKPTLDSGVVTWQITKNEEKSIIFGKETEVLVMPGLFNFHSHPKNEYAKLNRILGYPSGPDFNAFIWYVLSNHHTTFHSVLSVEGIYVISLQYYWASSNSNLEEVKKVRNEMGNNNYNFKEKYQLNYNYNKTLSVDQNAREYCKLVSNISFVENKPPLFLCQYFSWDDIEKTQYFTIAYPSLGMQCFVSENSMFEIYKSNPSIIDEWEI